MAKISVFAFPSWGIFGYSKEIRGYGGGRPPLRKSTPLLRNHHFADYLHNASYGGYTNYGVVIPQHSAQIRPGKSAPGLLK